MGIPADPQSWNRYAYVRNDPVNRVDPNGLSFFSWLVKAFRFIAEAVTGLPHGPGWPPGRAMLETATTPAREHFQKLVDIAPIEAHRSKTPGRSVPVNHTSGRRTSPIPHNYLP
jgi:hypothetical protein